MPPLRKIVVENNAAAVAVINHNKAVDEYNALLGEYNNTAVGVFSNAG